MIQFVNRDAGSQAGAVIESRKYFLFNPCSWRPVHGFIPDWDISLFPKLFT
jgi:hypothetical protein